jgi:hypothetical protein
MVVHIPIQWSNWCLAVVLISRTKHVQVLANKCIFVISIRGNGSFGTHCSLHSPSQYIFSLL